VVRSKTASAVEESSTADFAVVFDSVGKEFPARRSRGAIRAVDDVSLRVPRGRIVGVIGYSGAGKSTLVRMINGLEKPTSGTVSTLGVDVGAADEAALRALRGRIGMVFQQFNLFSSRTVRGNIAYPLKVAGWPKERIAARVAELLDFVGLADKADQFPRRLSGGQKQRVGIARALATNPDILLADEATSALDPQTTRDILDLLARANRELGITIVVITHQISVVHELCDEVIVMEQGRIVDEGDTYRVFAHPTASLTSRFVSDATQGVPRGDVLEALSRSGGALLSVDVNEFTSEDVETVFAQHGVRGVVVFGGVTDIRGRQLGTLTYRVNATEDAVGAVFADLAARTRVVRPDRQRDAWSDADAAEEAAS